MRAKKPSISALLPRASAEILGFLLNASPKLAAHLGVYTSGAIYGTQLLRLKLHANGCFYGRRGGAIWEPCWRSWKLAVDIVRHESPA
jgi:hypothetical protein